MLLQAPLTGMPQSQGDPAGCPGALPTCRPAQAGLRLQSSLCPVPPNLAMVYNAPIGVDALQAAMSVQLLRLVRTPQAEALVPSQQNVQVVVKVVMQSAGGTCSDEQPVQVCELSLCSVMQPTVGTCSNVSSVADAHLCKHFLAGCSLLEAPAADPHQPLVCMSWQGTACWRHLQPCTGF